MTTKSTTKPDQYPTVYPQKSQQSRKIGFFRGKNCRKALQIHKIQEWHIKVREN